MALLIQVEQLAELVGDSAVIVVDCRYQLNDRYRGYQDYCQGHIPGAHYASLGDDLSGPGPRVAGRHPLPQTAKFAGFLAEIGVTGQQNVVAYDDMGGQMAARFWWLCRWLGFDQVMLLDGGWQAWCAEHAQSTEKVTRPNSGSIQITVRPELVIDAESLRSGLDNRCLRLIDARAEQRFRGEDEPLDPVAGHIPGAINHPFSLNLGGDNRFHSATRLRQIYTPLLAGFRPPQVVHSCGSGVTACHNLFAMELAGLSGSRLFSASWSGWVADDANPVSN